MKKYLFYLTLLLAVAMIFGASASAQKTVTAKPKPVIFAVINDGKTIEPIAYVENGKLSDAVTGSDNVNVLTAFSNNYYGAKASYRLIFGGANAGTIAVKSSDPKADCSSTMATVETTTTKTPLSGHRMALATNAVAKKQGSGVRRLPTWPERNEIDLLVRAEFAENGVDVKKLDYHNLTALDVDGDKKAELVGSFWAESDAKSRTLLFFIAERGTDGKLKLTHTDLRVIKQDEVMNGEISTLDEGVYHELLLDVYDYDGDGVAEIFTYMKSFEGAGFTAYKRSAGKWTKAFEASNYHCAF